MFMLYFESNHSRQVTTYLLRYTSEVQNIPFRSQIIQIFFASGGKGALTSITGRS